MARSVKGSVVRYLAVVVPAMAAAATVLAGSVGCARGADEAGPAPIASIVATPTATSAVPKEPAPTQAPVRAPAATRSPAAPVWPSPEDCVSYDPVTLTMRYEAGIYSVEDGTRVVTRVSGQPGDTVGAKALAVAQRFRKHCFLGRDNTREDQNSYVFDYWRGPSGMTPDVPDQDEDCSPYNRTNLTVEDMGGGYGWRVKDHDHVLHLFDNESDARNGKLVLSRYHQICFLGSGDDNLEAVSYLS